MPFLDPQMLLRAYAAGVFPMAEGRDSDELYWVEPKRRGILPLDGFHLSHSLAKTLRQERFVHTADRAFDEVMRACAEGAPGRDETWINDQILEAYGALHRMGHAHSIECWRDGVLAGGLYGVRIGGAFFGESMFTRVRDASKAALAHLVARLRVGCFRLLDTQFLTAHLASLGTIEIGRDTYRRQLASALDVVSDFDALERLEAPSTMVSGPVSGKRIAQLLSQMS